MLLSQQLGSSQLNLETRLYGDFQAPDRADLEMFVTYLDQRWYSHLILIEHRQFIETDNEREFILLTEVTELDSQSIQPGDFRIEQLENIQLVEVVRVPEGRAESYHIRAEVSAELLGEPDALPSTIDYWIDTETHQALRVELAARISLPGEAAGQPERDQVDYIFEATYRYFSYGKALNILAPGNVVAADAPLSAESIVAGDVLMQTGFDDEDEWEYYVFPEDGMDLRVLDGVYRIRAEPDTFAWGLDYVHHENIIMEVTVTRNMGDTAAFGLMCRADPRNNGDGYYFMISGFDDFAIFASEGVNWTPLLNWRSTALVSADVNEYLLKAVCYEDRLAFYIDGILVGEVIDDTFSGGFAGFMAVPGEDESVDVSFDNLTIWQAVGPAERGGF